MMDSAEVIRRRKRGRKVVPILPAQQSPSERVAYNKNRVLQTRLQQHLNTLTKHRKSWLFQTHIQASKYRRRAEHLHDLLTPYQSPNSDPFHPGHGAFPCCDVTSARDVYTRQRKPKQQRPATSVQFRLSVQDNNNNKRPSTAASPRSKPLAVWKSAQQQPLSRSREKKLSASSEEEDTDSEDSLSTEDSGSDKAVKTIAGKDRTAHTCLLNRGSPDRSQPKRAQRTQSAFIRTPKQLSFSGDDTTARPQTQPGSVRECVCQKQTGKHDQKQLHKRHGSQPRAQTAPGASQRYRKLGTVALQGSVRPAQSRYGLSSAGGWRGSRDAGYIQYILNLERSRYELSQQKVRDYLQNLTL